MKKSQILLIILLLLKSYFAFGATISKQVHYTESDGKINFENSVVTLPGYFGIYSGHFQISYLGTIISSSISITSSSVCLSSNEKVFVEFPSDSLVCSVVGDRGKYFLQYMFNPFYIKDGVTYKIDSYQIHYQLSPRFEKSSSLLKSAVTSPLASGKWAKVKLDKSGVYKITGADLKSYGFSSVSTVRIFGDNGGLLPLDNADGLQPYMPEVPLYVSDGGDGTFDDNDYVLFYGQNPHTISYSQTSKSYKHLNNCYTESANFLITVNNGIPKRISSVDYSSLVSDIRLDYFEDVQLYEVNDTNIVLSGREFFQSAGNRTYEFNFPNYLNYLPSSLSHRVLGASSSGFDYSIYANESIVTRGTISGGDNVEGKDSDGKIDFTLLNQSLNFRVSRSGSSKFWLDYLLVSVPCQIALRSGQLVVRNSTSLDYNAVEYSLPSSLVQVWDVTDFGEVATVNHSGSSFKSPGGILRTFAMFDGTNFLKPEFVEEVTNQNIVGVNTVEMIIVAHPDFTAQAQRLANLHASVSGISTLIVTQDQIFNEFSSGRPDVAAVRNYLRYMYSIDGKLRYLLMFGDGSYKNSQLSPESNQLITYQSRLSSNTGSYVSDDFFGMFDAGEGEIDGALKGKIELGIGRIPVSNPDKAKLIVDKIIHYATSPDVRGSWRNNMAFLADDGDDNLHMKQADVLANLVESGRGEILTSKILADTYHKVAGSGGGRYPDANQRILDVIKKGVLLFNYTGHGNPVQFGGERYITAPDLIDWKNFDKLPLFITASCEVGRYDNPARLSLSELLLLQDDGGAIALMTTTRLVYSGPNFDLNKKIINQLFGTNDWGEPKTMGDIIRCSKNEIGEDYNQNKRNFSLLGDPALRLAVPTLKVLTDSINGQNVSVFTDTVSALSVVRISGHVENSSGDILSTYNGVIHPTVMDKYRIINTLNNDGKSKFTLEYKEYANILFKGQATIRNGYFTFSFLVPKDISYRFDKGKISYYADNGIEDGSGFENRFYVGGTSTNTISDGSGPEMNIYMNDSTFVFGGTTSESPTLLVKIQDESGVNITGNAVGHDLTAILDADVSNTYVLNDFYQADMDSYKQGSVRYPLTALAEGKHTVRVKVWDALNNSNEDFLEFYVSESADMALKHVLNYPNPFTTNTSFYFEHNQAGQQLEILVQIFTVSGRLIKTLESNQYASGFRNQAITWDGKDDFGDKIGRGVYFYRVKVRTEDGTTAEAYQKLVLLQ